LQHNLLVAHVDDGSTHFDTLRACGDRSEDGEWRGLLAGEVVDAQVSSVEANLLSRYSELNGLENGVASSGDCRAAPGLVVAEGEKSYVFHIC
jgi:hypothetical protein